jgi:hypothetical protein
MKPGAYTEAKIIEILKEAEAGMPANGERLRGHGNKPPKCVRKCTPVSDQRG